MYSIIAIMYTKSAITCKVGSYLAVEGRHGPQQLIASQAVHIVPHGHDLLPTRLHVGDPEYAAARAPDPQQVPMYRVLLQEHSPRVQVERGRGG